MNVGLFIIIISGMGMVFYTIKRILDIAEVKAKNEKTHRLDFYDAKFKDDDFLDKRMI